MKKISFLVKIDENLELKFINQIQLKQALLPYKGKILKTTFAEVRKNRSQEQNSYYWGVVISMIAQHTGYYTNEEKEDIHNELKRIILPRNGRLGIPKSTSNMNTIEFSDFIEKVRIWATQVLNLYIPNPNEVNNE